MKREPTNQAYVTITWSTLLADFDFVGGAAAVTPAGC